MLNKEQTNEIIPMAIGMVTTVSIGTFLLQAIGAFTLAIIGAFGGWVFQHYIRPKLDNKRNKRNNELKA